jgi:hypothetical protein
LELDEESIKLFEAFKAEQSHKLQTCSNEAAFKLLLKKTVKPVAAPTTAKFAALAKVTSDEEVKTQSRYIPKNIITQLKVRSQSQCEYVDPSSGLRCSSKHFIQIDHIKSFSQGGRSDDLKNLQILCRNHNNRKFEVFG